MKLCNQYEKRYGNNQSAAIWRKAVSKNVKKANVAKCRVSAIMAAEIEAGSYGAMAWRRRRLI